MCAFVHNFRPFFYVRVTDQNLTLDEDDIELLRIDLNNQMGGKEAVSSIEIVHKKVLGDEQDGKKHTFLKVVYTHDSYLIQLQKIVNSGLPSMSSPGTDSFSTTSYEGDHMPFGLRYMIDQNICGMSWIRITAGNWSLRPESEKQTHCQIEIDVLDFKDVIALPCDG